MYGRPQYCRGKKRFERRLAYAGIVTLTGVEKASVGPVLAGYDVIAAVHELRAANRNCFIVALDMGCR